MTSLDVTYAQAVIGDVVELEGLTGSLELNIDSGTQPADILKIKGEGLPRLHGGTRGDLYVEVDIVVPKKISDAERKLLIEMAELRDEPIPQGASKEGFFGSLFKRKK